MNETEVIIAGAGPTALMMAALLSRCGGNVRVLDENEQQAHETRAFAVQAKSLDRLSNLQSTGNSSAVGSLAWTSACPASSLATPRYQTPFGNALTHETLFRTPHRGG